MCGVGLVQLLIILGLNSYFISFGLDLDLDDLEVESDYCDIY